MIIADRRHALSLVVSGLHSSTFPQYPTPVLSELESQRQAVHDECVKLAGAILILAGWLLTTTRLSQRGNQLRYLVSALGVSLITAGVASMF